MFNGHINHFMPNFCVPPHPQPLNSSRVFFPPPLFSQLPHQTFYQQAPARSHVNTHFFDLSVPPPPIAQNVASLLTTNLNSYPTHRFLHGTHQLTTSERFSKTFHVARQESGPPPKDNGVPSNKRKRFLEQINNKESTSRELRIELDSTTANKPFTEQNAGETNQESADESPKSKESGCSENSQESIQLVATDNESDGEHPEMGRNWRMLMLFNNLVEDNDLAHNCERPQKEEGRTYPFIQKTLTQYFDEQEQQPLNPAMKLPLVDRNQQQEIVSTGHNNGGVGYATSTVWVSSDLLAKMKRQQQQAVPIAQKNSVLNNRTISPPMRQPDLNIRQSVTTECDSRQLTTRRRLHYNRSMVILKNGRRVYAGSRDCFQFLETGNCLNGVLCEFEHEGSTEHTRKKVCPFLMRGQCRNTDDSCPNGLHSTLKAHQMPVCDFYLRMCCSKGKDQCAYLHVKHTDGLDPCEEFNKGGCQRGVMCDQPHRYRYYRIKEKQMESPNQSANQPTNPVSSEQHNNADSSDKQNVILKWFS